MVWTWVTLPITLKAIVSTLHSLNSVTNFRPLAYSVTLTHVISYQIYGYYTYVAWFSSVDQTHPQFLLKNHIIDCWSTHDGMTHTKISDNDP